MRLTRCYWRMRSYWRLFILHKIAPNAHWAKSLSKRARNKMHKFLQVLFCHFRTENNYHQYLTSCDCSWATQALNIRYQTSFQQFDNVLYPKIIIIVIKKKLFEYENWYKFCLLKCNQCPNWMTRSLSYTKGMLLSWSLFYQFFICNFALTTLTDWCGCYAVLGSILANTLQARCQKRSNIFLHYNIGKMFYI